MPRVSRKSGLVDSPRRLLGALGLAARARQVRIGREAVEQAIQRGDATAVLLAGDAPRRATERLERLSEARGIASVVVLNGDRLGRALGRERVVSIAVTDAALGKRIVDLARQVDAEGSG